MKLVRENLLGILLTIAAFAASGVLYPKMPEHVPTHWNIHGVADGFMPKPWGPFILPAMMVGVLAFFAVIRAISPTEAPVERFARVYSIIAGCTMGFLFVVTVAAALAATGVPFNWAKVIMAALGALLLVLGNFMGKVTRNYFVGIRTPWTLANEEVWLRTHRVGGKVFVLAGLGMVAAVVVDRTVLTLPILIATAAIPAIYSYVIYRRVSTSKKIHG